MPSSTQTRRRSPTRQRPRPQNPVSVGSNPTDDTKLNLWQPCPGYCASVFIFVAGRLDSMVAYAVGRVVTLWTRATGRSQVPLAYGVFFLFVGWFLARLIRIMLGFPHPIFAVMLSLAYAVWSLMLVDTWRRLRLLEHITLEVDSDSLSVGGPLPSLHAVPMGLSFRRVWGWFGLLFYPLGAPLAPAALGMSLAYYVMLCVTPGGGTPVWTRARAALRRVVRRVARVPVPVPA